MNEQELLDNYDECVFCPKKEALKIICCHRTYPNNWANISSLNIEGKCKERERLFRERR